MKIIYIFIIASVLVPMPLMAQPAPKDVSLKPAIVSIDRSGHIDATELLKKIGDDDYDTQACEQACKDDAQWKILTTCSVNWGSGQGDSCEQNADNEEATCEWSCIQNVGQPEYPLPPYGPNPGPGAGPKIS